MTMQQPAWMSDLDWAGDLEMAGPPELTRVDGLLGGDVYAYYVFTDGRLKIQIYATNGAFPKDVQARLARALSMRDGAGQVDFVPECASWYLELRGFVIPPPPSHVESLLRGI